MVDIQIVEIGTKPPIFTPRVRMEAVGVVDGELRVGQEEVAALGPEIEVIADRFADDRGVGALY